MTYANSRSYREAKPKSEASSVNLTMKRLAPYGDPRINPYSLNEQILDPNLPHELWDAKYSKKSENFQSQDERIGRPSSNDIRWQMSHHGYQMSSTVQSHNLHEDPGNNGRRSYHQVHAINSSTATSFEKQDNREAVQHEEDMDIGYEDTPSPLTFDGLERKFNDEILRLVKEQSDLEDAEITRHKERLIEINTRYQQQLLSVRTKQAAQRQEFLHKESNTRRYQYQRPGVQDYSNSLTTGDFHQYDKASGMSASVPTGVIPHQYYPPELSADATRPYGFTTGAAARGYRDPHTQIESSSYSERGGYRGSMKAPDATSRVPFPEGRVYNTGSRHH